MTLLVLYLIGQWCNFLVGMSLYLSTTKNVDAAIIPRALILKLKLWYMFDVDLIVMYFREFYQRIKEAESVEEVQKIMDELRK